MNKFMTLAEYEAAEQLARDEAATLLDEQLDPREDEHTRIMLAIWNKVNDYFLEDLDDHNSWNEAILMREMLDLVEARYRQRGELNLIKKEKGAV